MAAPSSFHSRSSPYIVDGNSFHDIAFDLKVLEQILEKDGAVCDIAICGDLSNQTWNCGGAMKRRLTDDHLDLVASGDLDLALRRHCI